MLSPLKPGNDVRFDDSLKTILAADMATDFGAQSAWRQLVDLMGRGRMAVDAPAIARLRLLRQAVPVEVRAASARALAFAKPDANLVGFFAEDVLAIAAPVLRTADLEPHEWLELLPRLTPPSRSVLRHRRDLAPEVQRGLLSFGPTDFVLPHPDAPIELKVAEAEPVVAEPIAPEPAPVERAAVEQAPILGIFTTEAPRWISWAIGDFSVKLIVGLVMLLPYGALMNVLRPVKAAKA